MDVEGQVDFRSSDVPARAALDDRAFVERWFRHRRDRIGNAGQDVHDVRVSAVQRLSRGVSRQTWTVEAAVLGHDGTWTQRSFVVRRDHETGSIIPTDLRTEFEVYHRLRGTPVPTTDALWFEEDPEWQPDGRAAYIRTLVEGDWRLPFLADESPEQDAARIAACREHLDKLALVHSLDWEGLGFGEIFAVPSSPADCAENLIEVCLGQLADFGSEPSPVLAESVAWLRAQAPRDAGRICLCKGTNGHGEEVWADGRIVAMSDWELAAIGDPAYDLAQVQEMVPEIHRDGRRVWGWPETLEYYRERTGTTVPMESVEYYRRFYGLLQFVYTQHAAAQVRTVAAPDLRFVWNAAEVGYRSQLRLARIFGIELMAEAVA
jgi:aminoglycoside phosphotransferase (APT) family kinase protein